MSKKGGRPKQEPTGVRGVRFPVRIWKLVKEASINFRSINEYLRYLIEEDFKNRNYKVNFYNASAKTVLDVYPIIDFNSYVNDG